jgi:type IV fimbrial biogenesis protein FimT
MRMHSQRHRHNGFTLTELMVTIAVIAMLAMFAVPSFNHQIRRHRVSTAVSQLKADLAYARAEAATRGSFVSICASSDGTSCSGETSYASGWLVYAYPAGVAGANQPYDASQPAKFALLRTAGNQHSVAVTATDGGILTYGQQGQIKRDLVASPFNFIVCSRADANGDAENIPSIPGIQIGMVGSGGVSTQTLAAGASCS